MKREKTLLLSWVIGLLALLIVACDRGNGPAGTVELRGADSSETGKLTLPVLEPVTEDSRKVKLVATTGIIGDVVSAVAGNDAEVSVLMAPNQDPHGYQTTAADLRLAANADAVLVNGWRLEEGLIDDLENAAQDIPFVPVSAGIEARYYDAAGTGQPAGRIDPHVWLSPMNVIRWVDNIEQVLAALDPGRAESYAERAEEYRARLNALDAYAREQIEQIDISKRVLVTNHDAFGYFADTYGLSVIGTIIPGDSSLSEPSSRDLADLVDEMGRNSVCAIFVEHSASQRLASQLADELDHCSDVQVVSLYSGALGEQGSGAETYLTMMRANIDMIVSALSSGRDPLDAS